MQPGRARAFFESHIQAAAQTVDQLQNRFRFRFDNRLHDQLAARIQNGHGDRCLVHIEPNILSVAHEGAPFGVGSDAIKTYSKGAPSYNALIRSSYLRPKISPKKSPGFHVGRCGFCATS